MAQEPQLLSTTALAKALGKDAKEVFALLARAHWMVKVDDRWSLTEKGRFEGGVYLHHPKFGDYVAWPEAVREHGIWQDLPPAPLTATHLGRQLGLPARLVNVLLADLGWQKKGLKGWLVTDFGRLQGGHQQRAENSNIPYVTWPESVAQDAALQAAVACLNAGTGLDGHRYPDLRHASVGNWLYLHGIAFALDRHLPTAPGPVSFWLPREGLIVHLWAAAAGAADIQHRLSMETWLKRQRALVVPDSLDGQIAGLDDWLPGQLLLAGVDC